jgi:hypothetical protein
MPARHDWPNLRKEFDLAIEAGSVPHLKAWCEAKNLSYTTVSRNFAEMDDYADMLVRQKLKRVAPSAVNRLADAMASDDHRIGIEASKAILDRSGHSPQAQLVSIQNNIQQNQAVVIPPMFAGVDADELKKAWGGE